MKIRNSEVQQLGALLYNLSLKGKTSRMRTRFVNILDLHLREVVLVEQKMLAEQYARKDENGNFLEIKGKEGQIKLIEETAQEYHQEFFTLMNEFMYIDETEANKMMLLSVAETVLEGDFEVSGDEAVLYDTWCEKFEEVIENYNQKDLSKENINENSN